MNQHPGDNGLTRRHVLALGAGLGSAAALGLPGTSYAASQLIVSNGQPRAVIVRPDTPDDRVTHACDTLRDYIAKSTGASLAIVTQGGLGGNTLIRIYVGFVGTDSEPGTAAQLVGLKDDGYVIRTGINSVTIVGPTSWGTRYGVYEFLERLLGIRWLMPNRDDADDLDKSGEDVPSHSSVTIPETAIRHEPSAICRIIAPLTDPDYFLQNDWEDDNTWKVWASYNRMRYSIEATHNLFRLFKPSEYGQDHEGIYPLRAGSSDPDVPVSDTVWAGWQPRFAQPYLVTAGIAEIIEFFTDNPTRASISLGINDGGGFSVDETAGKPFNSLGYPNMSNLYYGWVKAVVEGAIAQMPSLATKKFGLIAYQHVYDPPSFTLPSQVVPFICRERYGWVDPAIRTQQQNTLQAWRAVATNLGWYDYNYGINYGAPRLSLQTMSDAYKYAALNDVIGEYAELSPNWGEGPKPWINAKLMWNPNLNVTTLLQDWCTHAVGPTAAPALVDYFELWDYIWTQIVPTVGWFHTGKNRTYFDFGSASYLNAIADSHLATMRGYMQTVVSNANTPERLYRANLLKTAFDYYDKTRISFPDRQMTPANSTDAIALIDMALQQYQWNTERNTLITQITQAQTITRSNLAGGAHTWSWNGWIFWQLHDYLKNNEPSGGPVTTRLQNEAANPSATLKKFATLLLNVVGGAPSVLANPSFESGTTTATSWNIWREENRGTITRVTQHPRTGTASLRATGVQRGGPFQTIPSQPGLITARIHYYSPTGIGPDGVIRLTCNLLSSTSTVLASLGALDTRRFAITEGAFGSTCMLLDIPATVNSTTVDRIQFVATMSGLAATDNVYIDDFMVYR